MVIKALAVNGERQSISPDAPSAYPGLTHKSSIALSDTVRGHAMPEPIALDPGDLVELQFEDGIKWLGPCDMLEDLFPEGMQRKRAGEDVFEVTGHLEHPEATRGLGKAVLKVLNVFAKKTSMALAKPAIKELAQKIERKIWGMEAGLWSVRDNLNFVPLEALDTNVPILLLLHGTGSSAQSSFEKLPGTPLWKYWQETYGLNIVAFQHETLSKSPLENAVDLLGQLPANATLHLVSHSRGGLVGEVLSRFSKIDMAPTEGFTDADIQLLNDAGQANDARAIGHLRELANKKQFKVEKFIRVACPAAGTTLLSKRLDYFVNIVLNLVGAATGAATNPLYEAFKELLVAVVDQKNDPDVLPGLEAMKPSSLFIQLLNNRADSSIPIAVPVSVISGNCKVGLRLNSLLVIASKLFFWEDNDLIVDTRSMYWGAKKTNGLQYFLDEGSAVNHFHYFKNEKTQTAILDAFKATGSAPIKGFRPWQEGNWGDAQRNAALGLEGGQFFMDNPSGKKPILVLLPGIMGSNIKQGGDLIWINYLRFITGGLRRIGIHAKDIAVPSIVATSYKELARSLSTEYDVVTFPYDWRQSMVVSAGLLDKKINQLLAYNQPIKIIGHSMGGVLVRDFILYHGKTWQKLNARKDFRLLFLGAPLGGSYRILRVLLGQDELIKKLALVDVVHGIKGLLEIFTQFPGILSLLPLTKDGDNDFADSKVWKQMAMYLGNEQWPIPDTIPGNNAGEKKLLQAFAEYRNKVVDEQPHIDFKNAVYVAGRGKFTTCGYRKDQTVRGKELTFLATAEGDQSVTWNSGIPANMDKQQVYYVNVPHGSLASTPSMFAGIRELLSKGETNLFSRNRPVVRSTEKLFKQPDTLNFDLTPRGLENTLLGISETKAMTVGELPIKVRVAHGHLKYAAYPLLAGHFKNDSILYAEKAINEKLQGLLAERHAINLYPGDIGTSEILLTQTQQVDDFAGAIIVGLGEPGTLNSHGLRLTVEQAVARYLLMINGRDKLKTPLQHKTPLGISSLIIGCGYGGLSIENSIGAIIEGVVNANAKIKGLYQENAKWIERIQFVELYEDRLLSCCYALQDLCSQEGGLLNIEREQEGVEKLWGSRKRINLLMNEEWWNRIVVRTGEQRKGTAKSMNFVLGNNRARQDERDVFTTTGIIEKLAKVISTDNRWDNEKARALYQLLVPNDFKDEVKKYGNIVWVLDNYTAGFPWELLHDRASGAKPLCIGSGMIRQLISSKGRTKIETVSTKTALVVGDPNLKGYITQLSGALAEASAVASLLKENQYETKELLRKSSEEIIPALLGADYKIIHLAGHGEFNEDNPVKESGMVIGNNEYLTTAEIAQIGASSDLVFVNCCFLGQTDGHAEELFQQRYKLAANIGTQLIDNGVKAVVAAGWAVDDEAALDFAKRFYSALFEGYAFGEAVRLAREEIYQKHGQTNTWGAYQCYGDPFFRLTDRDKQTGPKHGYVLSKQAEIDLDNLLSDLETREPGDEDMQWALDRLLPIGAEVDKLGLRNQAITEKEAFVYIELNMAEKAVERFEQLQEFDDATYSFMAIERYYKLRAEKLYRLAGTHQLSNEDLTAEFDGVLRGLQGLLSIKPTAERNSLLGSSYKKKASLVPITDEAGKVDKKQLAIAVEDLRTSAKYYYQAYQQSADGDAIYPFVNWVALQCLLVNAGDHSWGQDAAEPLRTTAAIQQKIAFFEQSLVKWGHAGEYFDLVRPANMKFCRWLLQFTSKDLPAIDSNEVVEAYKSVWSEDATTAQKQAELLHVKVLQQIASQTGKDKKQVIAHALESVMGLLQGLI